MAMTAPGAAVQVNKNSGAIEKNAAEIEKTDKAAIKREKDISATRAAVGKDNEILMQIGALAALLPPPIIICRAAHQPAQACIKSCARTPFPAQPLSLRFAAWKSSGARQILFQLTAP